MKHCFLYFTHCQVRHLLSSSLEGNAFQDISATEKRQEQTPKNGECVILSRGCEKQDLGEIGIAGRGLIYLSLRTRIPKSIAD
jgi:hypothetical protein